MQLCTCSPLYYVFLLLLFNIYILQPTVCCIIFNYVVLLCAEISQLCFIGVDVKCIIIYFIYIFFFHILLLLFEFKYIFIRSTANSLLCLSYLLLWYYFVYDLQRIISPT